MRVDKSAHYAETAELNTAELNGTEQNTNCAPLAHFWLVRGHRRRRRHQVKSSQVPRLPFACSNVRRPVLLLLSRACCLIRGIFSKQTHSHWRHRGTGSEFSVRKLYHRRKKHPNYYETAVAEAVIDVAPAPAPSAAAAPAVMGFVFIAQPTALTQQGQEMGQSINNSSGSGSSN